jgi:hypothetical protein
VTELNAQLSDVQAELQETQVATLSKDKKIHTLTKQLKDALEQSTATGGASASSALAQVSCILISINGTNGTTVNIGDFHLCNTTLAIKRQRRLRPALALPNWKHCLQRQHRRVVLLEVQHYNN